MRRVPRIPVEMDAVLISEGANLQGTITDIGLQGAFVTLCAQTNVDYLFNLRFCLPTTQKPLEFWCGRYAELWMGPVWNSWTLAPRSFTNYGWLSSLCGPES